MFVTASFILMIHQLSDVGPMLFECLTGVVDGVPSLKQHWDNVLCIHPDTFHLRKRNVGPASQIVDQH